jgi:hypothetical protein
MKHSGFCDAFFIYSRYRCQRLRSMLNQYPEELQALD